MSDFNLQDLDVWLLNCEVGHLDGQSMEVDSIETFVHCLSKPWLAVNVDALLVVHGACLVELSEQAVEFDD